MTCPPRQAPSSTYRQPASSSGHDSRGSSVQRGKLGELAPRQAQREEIALDQLRSAPAAESRAGARRRQPRQAGFDRSVEPKEALEDSAIAVEREIGVEQP